MTDHIKKCIAVAEDLKLTPAEFAVFEAIWCEAARRQTGAPVAQNHTITVADKVAMLADLLASTVRNRLCGIPAVPVDSRWIAASPGVPGGFVHAPVMPDAPGVPVAFPPGVRAMPQAPQGPATAQTERGQPSRPAPVIDPN